MKKSFAVICVVLTFAMVAAAQDIPKMETFIGYTYVRANSATNIPAFSANGGSGQFVYNFNKWLGAVADLGAVNNNHIGRSSADTTMANFLFGPRFSLHYSRVRPYFQILWGGVYATSSTQVTVIPVINPLVDVNPLIAPVVPGTPLVTGTPILNNLADAITARIGASQTAFAMTAGGGLDIRLSKHVSLRPIGLDYYLTRLQNLRSANDNNQNNLRYTAGINFTFGAQ